MYMITTISKTSHALSDEEGLKYGKTLAEGKSFVIRIPTKHGEAFVLSHQIVEIVPIQVWSEQNLLSMREKGQMLCGHCRNVKSIHSKCPHCQDNYETARTIKKIDYNEEYFSALYGIGTQMLNAGA